MPDPIPHNLQITLQDIQIECIANLESLAFALDPFYREHFEEPQLKLCRALTDYRRGRPVTLLDGTTVDPKDYNGFLCMFPRDTFKSAIICELYPVWLFLYWVFERRMQPSVYVFQATLEKAKLHMAKVKRLMCSPEFRAIFGNTGIVPRHGDPEKWGTQEYFDLSGMDMRGKREHSCQIASIGAAFTGHHPTDVINDDPETEENYASETEQQRVFAGMQLQDNLPDTDWGLRYFVGTPYTSMGVNHRVQSGDLGPMMQYVLPAFEEPPDLFYRWANTRTPDEERALLGQDLDKHYTLMFPKRLTFSRLARKFQGQGSRFFSSQQLLSVTDSSSAIFRREWFEAALVERSEAAKRAKTRRCLFIDSAWKRPEKKGTGDDTAMGVVDYDKDGDPYLLDLILSDSLTEAQGMEQMGRWVSKWNIRKIVKETFGEDTFAARWRDYCKSNGIRYVPITKPKRVATSIGKENRIRGMAPAFEMGRYFIVDDLPYLSDLRRQFVQYAGEGSGKDDGLDMMADALMEEVKPGASHDGEKPAWQSTYRPLSQVSREVLHREPPSVSTGWMSLRGRV